MFIPKNTKYRKYHKMPIKGKALRGSTLAFGGFGLQATSTGRITSAQIEACRQVIRRKTKRTGKLWIRIFPHWPITSKPTETRMGKGKGAVSHWIARVKTNKILFEVDGVSKDLATEALKSAAVKLPISVRIINK